MADLAKAINRLRDTGGGLTAVKNGELLHSVPLPIAGLLSDKSAEWVNDSLGVLKHAQAVIDPFRRLIRQKPGDRKRNGVKQFSVFHGC